MVAIEGNFPFICRTIISLTLIQEVSNGEIVPSSPQTLDSVNMHRSQENPFPCMLRMSSSIDYDCIAGRRASTQGVQDHMRNVGLGNTDGKRSEKYGGEIFLYICLEVLVHMCSVDFTV